MNNLQKQRRSSSTMGATLPICAASNCLLRGTNRFKIGKQDFKIVCFAVKLFTQKQETEVQLSTYFSPVHLFIYFWSWSTFSRLLPIHVWTRSRVACKSPKCLLCKFGLHFKRCKLIKLRYSQIGYHDSLGYSGISPGLTIWQHECNTTCWSTMW